MSFLQPFPFSDSQEQEFHCTLETSQLIQRGKFILSALLFFSQTRFLHLSICSLVGQTPPTEREKENIWHCISYLVCPSLFFTVVHLGAYYLKEESVRTSVLPQDYFECMSSSCIGFLLITPLIDIPITMADNHPPSRRVLVTHMWISVDASSAWKEACRESDC